MHLCYLFLISFFKCVAPIAQFWISQMFVANNLFCDGKKPHKMFGRILCSFYKLLVIYRFFVWQPSQSLETSNLLSPKVLEYISIIFSLVWNSKKRFGMLFHDIHNSVAFLWRKLWLSLEFLKCGLIILPLLFSWAQKSISNRRVDILPLWSI